MAGRGSVVVVVGRMEAHGQSPSVFHRNECICHAGGAPWKMRSGHQKEAGGKYNVRDATWFDRRVHIVSVIVKDVQVVPFKFPLLFAFFTFSQEQAHWWSCKSVLSMHSRH